MKQEAALTRKHRTDLAEHCGLIRRHGFCFDLTGDAGVLGGKMGPGGNVNFVDFMRLARTIKVIPGLSDRDGS